MNQRVLHFVLLIFILISNTAHAQIMEMTERATATGNSKRQAVEAALVQATGQAFGVAINATTNISDSTVLSGSDNAATSKFLTSVNDQIQQKIKSPTNNPILGYSIESIKQLPNSLWEAAVVIKYAKYKGIGAKSERRSFVVVSGDQSNRDLVVADFSKALVGSRRFDILNRNNQNLFEREKAFISGSDASRAEVARLGQATGADYLAIVSLQGLGVNNNKQETIQMTGERLVSSSASGSVNVEVIEFSSRKLKWSGSEKFSGNYNGAVSVTSANLSSLISSASEKLVANLIASIYPIEVVKILSKNMAIINRGEASVKIGQKFTLYLKGEELIDKQSGESLGPLETKIGKGKILDTNPKYSTIKLDEGDFDSNASYIAR